MTEPTDALVSEQLGRLKAHIEMVQQKYGMENPDEGPVRDLLDGFHLIVGAYDAIERLTRERDEARETISDMRVMATERERKAVVRADQAEAERDAALVELVKKLEHWSVALKIDSNRAMSVREIAEVNGECITTALDEAIAALQPGGERKWPDTICNDIDKMLRQHIRWTQGDHSEGTYIEGWRKAARAVEEYIQKMQRAPAPVAVTVNGKMVQAALDTFGMPPSFDAMKRALSAALAAEVG